MKLQIGKTYWTRDRKRFVRIIDLNEHGYVGGYYLEVEDYMTQYWNEDGSFLYQQESPFDLIEEINIA